MAPADPHLHRFTREEYLRMGEVGILGSDDRVELIDGHVTPMSPIGNRHVASVLVLEEMLRGQVPEGIRVVVQNAVNISEHSQVQPDIALVALPSDLWKVGISGADCRLVIEVAETSQSVDRGRKLKLYAAAGILEYWVVDLAAGQVEVFSGPEGSGYGTRSVYPRGATIASAAVAGVSVPVARVAGP